MTGTLILAVLYLLFIFVLPHQINNLRNSHRIHIDGTDVPDPVTQFEQLRERYRIHARLVVNIGKAGFEAPTPVQMQAISIMLEVCSCAPLSHRVSFVCVCLLLLWLFFGVWWVGFFFGGGGGGGGSIEFAKKQIVQADPGIHFSTLSLRPITVFMNNICVVILFVQQRRDIMACAPTGSGKTAAFVIPVLHHLREPRNQGFRAVLLTPTRELAKQV